MRTRPPAAFDLNEVLHQPQDLYPPEPSEDKAKPPLVTRRKGWGRILAAAVGSLTALAAGLALDGLIRELFARYEWLGWAGLALAGLAVLAVAAIAWREIASIMNLQHIDRMRDAAVRAADTNDANAARAVITDLDGLYRGRPDTARGRAAVAEHRKEIIDGRDLVGLAERSLLEPLDKQARQAVVAASRRVAVVTAVSPRAVVDLAYVAIEILRLIRFLATLYGGRPGTFGFYRLARATLAHLAVTGGMAAGESIVQQVLGHGLAARLSARLGEGVINGLLTARIGIAAAEVCRPLPYREGKPPRLADVMKVLRPLSRSSEESD